MLSATVSFGGHSTFSFFILRICSQTIFYGKQVLFSGNRGLSTLAGALEQRNGRIRPAFYYVPSDILREACNALCRFFRIAVWKNVDTLQFPLFSFGRDISEKDTTVSAETKIKRQPWRKGKPFYIPFPKRLQRFSEKSERDSVGLQV